MGHFEFSVGVGGQGAIPKSYRLGFKETWAHLARKVCEANRIGPNSFIRLTHIFEDERCTLPGDEIQINMGSSVVPAEAWSGAAIPKSALPGVIVHVNKAQKVCQVRWTNGKVSKKCKIIGADDANHKNMQLLRITPQTLDLELSPFEYGTWALDATIVVEVTTTQKPQFTKVSSIHPQPSTPPTCPRLYLKDYGARLNQQSDDDEEENTNTHADGHANNAGAKSTEDPAPGPKQSTTGTGTGNAVGRKRATGNSQDSAPPAKRPFQPPKPPAPVLPAKPPAAVRPTSGKEQKLPGNVIRPSMAPAKVSAAVSSNATPRVVQGSAESNKMLALGEWMNAGHLSKWMMSQQDAVVRLSAPIFSSNNITGDVLLKWLREPPVDSRTNIPPAIDSVTLKAIRDAARIYDPTIPVSPIWPCGCSAHLVSIYGDPPIHLGSYLDVGKKIKIGRHSDSDYQLVWKDRQREVYMTISRIHCEIVLTQHGWMTCDNSENGTFVNDDLVQQGKGKLLRPGDTVSLGPPTKETRFRGYSFKFRDLGG